MTPKDRSGTVAKDGGGAAISTRAAEKNRERKLLYIGNPDATNPLWVEFGKDAVAASPSMQIPPGGHLGFAYPACPTCQVFVIGAADQAFTIKEG